MGMTVEMEVCEIYCTDETIRQNIFIASTIPLFSACSDPLVNQNSKHCHPRSDILNLKNAKHSLPLQSWLFHTFASSRLPKVLIQQSLWNRQLVMIWTCWSSTGCHWDANLTTSLESDCWLHSDLAEYDSIQLRWDQKDWFVRPSSGALEKMERQPKMKQTDLV